MPLATPGQMSLPEEPGPLRLGPGDSGTFIRAWLALPTSQSNSSCAYTPAPPSGVPRALVGAPERMRTLLCPVVSGKLVFPSQTEHRLHKGRSRVRSFTVPIPVSPVMGRLLIKSLKRVSTDWHHHRVLLPSLRAPSPGRPCQTPVCYLGAVSPFVRLPSGSSLGP